MAIVTTPEQQYADEVAKMPIAEVAAAFQKLVGQKLVAYIAGLSDPKMIGRYARQEHDPRDETALRMRYGYHVAWWISAAYGDATAKSWLVGSNPTFNDEAPAYVLHNAGSHDDLRLIVPAARAFVGESLS